MRYSIVSSPPFDRQHVQYNPTKSKTTNKYAGFVCFTVHTRPLKSSHNWLDNWLYMKSYRERYSHERNSYRNRAQKRQAGE